MGLLTAFFIITIRLGHTRTGFQQTRFSHSYRFSFDGPLTFLSSGKLDSMRLGIETIQSHGSVIINMSRVTMIDASAAEQLVEIVKLTVSRGARIALQSLANDAREVLIANDPSGVVGQSFSLTESDTFTDQPGDSGTAPIERLISGVEHFMKNSRTQYQPLFHRLATTQSPHTLFITCCDSRIDPNLITSTDPGELFIVRNVGNMVPTCEKERHEDATPAEGAAIEFALHILKVSEIVVCGHSGCAAMKAIFSKQNFAQLPSLDRWLHATNRVYDQIGQGKDPDHAARLNTLTQIEHLRTYPIIIDKLKSQEIRLHAWYYDIRSGQIEEYNETLKGFRPIGENKNASALA